MPASGQSCLGKFSQLFLVFFLFGIFCVPSSSVLGSGSSAEARPTAVMSAAPVNPLQEGTFWVERFEQDLQGSFSDPMMGPAPMGWEAPHFKNGIRDYAVMQLGPERFLRARYIPNTSGKVIFKKTEWDLHKYPFFSWKWRVNQWATGSTVKSSKKEDSSASVYVTLRSGMRAYVIKYIWAETDAIGDGYSKGEWNPSGRLMATVIRSGGALGEWKTEKRNIAEDFKTLYKKPPPHHLIKGIGVMTEGDGTKSIPEADYDDFQALAH